MAQIARIVSMEGFGFLKSGDFVIHDRDRKFCWSFRQIIESVGIRRVALPPRSPNLNAFKDGVTGLGVWLSLANYYFDSDTRKTRKFRV